MTPRSRAVLAVFVGPAACLVNLVVGYVLSDRSSKVPMLAASAIAAVVAAIGLLVSGGILRRRTEVFEVDRFVAALGIATNAFFLFVVVVGFGTPEMLLGLAD